MLNYLWFPFLDRLYRQVPNVWTYLEAKKELETVNWCKEYRSARDYTSWCIIDGMIWHDNTVQAAGRPLLAITNKTVLADNGEQYSHTTLVPVKRRSLLNFIQHYYVGTTGVSILALDDLRRRLHALGAKHKFCVLEVVQGCVVLQLRPPPVIMKMIHQLVIEVRR